MSSRSSKKTSSERRPPETVEVGRIRRAHGVRGALAVESFSDVPERFAAGRELLARVPAGLVRRLTIGSARPFRGGLLVSFEGIADRDAAEELRGALLEVPRDEVPDPPEGTYYHFQLVGCRIRDAREGSLGEVADVIEDGGGVLLVVEDGRRRLLIPFVRELVREMAVGRRTIEVELPEGLVETCASRS
ncbi:MAG: ribosome maturation factor RimM [Acidobacteriota bacterium]|jgi:16S rRNA processing protein RimM